MGVNIQTIKEIRLYLEQQLGGIYPVHEVSAMTAIILKDVLKSPDIRNLALPEARVLQKHVNRIISVSKELKKGKPLQYVLGYTDFYNCKIRLNEHTLIPRPETEELVDLIIKENKGNTGRILDVGTGSGCIAISLSINLPATSVSGFDISEGAIAIARENASLNKTHVLFFTSDLFNVDKSLVQGTNIIVSNPPYICESEKIHMAPNVLDFEPHESLFVPDSDPLVYYREIINLASDILVPGGRIYFEINETKGKQMQELLKSAGYRSVEVVRDINNKERIIKGIRYDRK